MVEGQARHVQPAMMILWTNGPLIKRYAWLGLDEDLWKGNRSSVAGMNRLTGSRPAWWYELCVVVHFCHGGTISIMVERFVTFRTDAKGRTVIPAMLREQAGIREGGDVLVGYIEEGRLVIETRAAVRRRLRSQAAATGASGVVDRLLADRRTDREREEHDRPGRRG